MSPIDKCRRLADTILSSLEDGIIIDTPTQRYIDACLPGLSIEEVAHRICEMPDLDAAPLMDLIFFPDETLQARLEPLLEAEMYDREDEAAVLALLETEAIRTTIRGPESRRTAAIRIPTSALAPLVRRLGISRHLPPGLADTISRLHPPEEAVHLKVMLRNSRFSLNASTADFLEAFILGMAPGNRNFEDCFELALELLECQGTETDPFRLLRSKTDALCRARDAALQFEKQLHRSNMETLMQQGIRAPEIGVAETEEKIALLDRIGSAVAVGGCEARRREEDRINTETSDPI